MSAECAVNPSVLGFARHPLSLREATERTGIGEERLEDMENGRVCPTVGELERLASAYCRPLALFFMSEPPKRAGIEDLRTNPVESPEFSALVRHVLLVSRMLEEIGKRGMLTVPGLAENGVATPRLVATGVADGNLVDKGLAFMAVGKTCVFDAGTPEPDVADGLQLHDIREVFREAVENGVLTELDVTRALDGLG